jgi:hypothetical protein
MLALSFGGLGSGCSVMFVKPPTTWRNPTLNLECTKRDPAPRIDAVMSVLGSAVTALILAADDSTFEGRALDRGGYLAVYGLATAAYAASAVYGFSSVRECRNRTAPQQQVEE